MYNLVLFTRLRPEGTVKGNIKNTHVLETKNILENYDYGVSVWIHKIGRDEESRAFVLNFLLRMLQEHKIKIAKHKSELCRRSLKF